jgi:hypothetical protein
MKKSCLFIFLFISFSAKSSESDVFEALQYGAGIYGSIYIHELGHAITAKYYGGYDIDIDVPRKDGGWLSGNTSYKLPKRTYESERVTAVSGLVATTLVSEVIIQNDGLYKNPFAQSVLATSHVTNIRYVYKYYTNDSHAIGDLEQYARAGGYIHAFNALLVGYTVWSLKRMSDKSIPLFSVGFKF